MHAPSASATREPGALRPALAPSRGVRRWLSGLLPGVLMSLALCPSVALAVVTASAGGVTYRVDLLSYPDSGGVQWTQGFDVSDQGLVVGAYDDANGMHYAFTYDSRTGTYTRLRQASEAYGVNGSGEVVGLHVWAGGDEGFRYAGGVYTSIRVPGAWDTVATEISDTGTIVGHYWDGTVNKFSGFVQSTSGYASVAYPGAENTILQGITAGGTILGMFDNQGYYPSHAFLYDGTHFTPIDYPGAAQTNAYKISDDGKVVGWAYTPRTLSQNFVYDISSGSFAAFSFSEGYGTLRGINKLGQLTGDYTSPADGKLYGFLATPVPEPPALAMALVGLMTLGVARRMWRCQRRQGPGFSETALPRIWSSMRTQSSMNGSGTGA